jgi:spermidine synthase
MKAQFIKKFTSQFNNQIELVKNYGNYSLLVNTYIQSGPEIENLWSEAFDKLLPESQIHNVLILGFGAGSIMTPLKKRFPRLLVSAVEIDPVMIEIAQEYFPENVKSVSITNADAVAFINSLSKKTLYDLVIVDCYIGGKEPEDIKKLKFLVNLRQIGKNVLLNQLFLPNDKTELKKIDFIKKLDKLYTVSAIKLPYNIILKY